MDHELGPGPDDLVLALGRLGEAQERRPDSPEVDLLTRRVESIRDALFADAADR